MKRRSAIRNIVIAGAASLFGDLLRARPGDEPSSDYTLHTEARLVLLDVSVKNRHGAFVSGLSKDNFSVFENGRAQAITAFDHDDLPVSMGILVDESGSMRPKRADVLSAAQTFIEESNRQDEVFVLNFNDTVVPGLPPPMLFSDNLRQLQSALFHGIAEGKTALNDAVLAGLKQLESGRHGKKAIILISDGGDNASAHDRRQVVSATENSTATIYSIGLFDNDDPDRNPALLRQLAQISGGEAYFPQSPAEMTPICKRIAKDIRSRYTLGYVPEANNGTRSLRHIRVQAWAPDHAKLVTVTRDRYRYDDLQQAPEP